MIVGDQIRRWRVEKNLSQGDIERRTGLLRCYLSRVENGHTVPSIETLQRISHALELPLYRLMYTGDEPPEPPVAVRKSGLWGESRKEARLLSKLRHHLSMMSPHDRIVLMATASHLANHGRQSLKNYKAKTTVGK